MTGYLEYGLVGLLITAALWASGARIRGALAAARGPDVAARFFRRFIGGGAGLAIACFVVGLLYRLHTIGLSTAALLYAPVVVLFVAGMKWLQPYLHEGEGDSDHER